jgi:hypothetical protein
MEILGSPLIDIRIADLTAPRGPARGWIALGDMAVGRLFAAGGLAVGTFAFGGVAIGIVPLGGLAIGALAFGGGAVGIFAIGGCAIGWQLALGGLAVAREYAIGGAAFARHANDPEAHRYLSLLLDALRLRP